MKVTPFGRGIHKREIVGIERLKKELPSDWFAYTNLDVVIGLGKPREVDVIIVADKRIFLVDLKDWHGKVESVGGNWIQNGRNHGQSPVLKIADIQRKIGSLLTESLKRRPETRGVAVPRVVGVVVMTGNADVSGIADTESQSVLSIDEFIKALSNPSKEREKFGNVAPEFLKRPLTGEFWKDKLSKFFTGASFKDGQRRYGPFIAEPHSSFEPPHGIYREFDAEDEARHNTYGTLRLWDFANCADTRFQSEEGIAEIAGRERDIYAWLRDRNEQLEQIILSPQAEDPERGPRYWEVYDRRPRLLRLSEFVVSELPDLKRKQRIELATQVLSGVAMLHRLDAAHADIGPHCIWLDKASSVRLSHFFAASYPQVNSLAEGRFQFLTANDLPEDVLDIDLEPKKRDVFMVGCVVHQLLFGRPPAGSPAEWNPEVDENYEFSDLHAWFAEALDFDPSRRFSDANIAHKEFLQLTSERAMFADTLSKIEKYSSAEIHGQMDLAMLFPPDNQILSRTLALDTWTSSKAKERFLVKLWKQPAWGDLNEEARTVLSFLERGTRQVSEDFQQLSQIKAVAWLGDSICAVFKWVDGKTLTETTLNRTQRISIEDAGSISSKLISCAEKLHSEDFFHGDIKPDNVVINEDGLLTLIDYLDFSPAKDGPKKTTAYAPETNDPFQRDRFAVCKIVREIFAAVELTDIQTKSINAAIESIVDGDQPLATLMPLATAISNILEAGNRPSTGYGKSISISIIGSEPGQLQPDEGEFYLRFREDKFGNNYLHIRGAAEEIQIRLDQKLNPINAKRQVVQQKFVDRNKSSEFMSFEGHLKVVSNDLNDFSQVADLLQSERADEAIKSFMSGRETPVDEDVALEGELNPDDEEAGLERLAEATSIGVQEQTSFDVLELWKKFIEKEDELNVEAVVTAPAGFDRKTNAVIIPFSLEAGAFDFSANDNVKVLKKSKKGDWKAIGSLDLLRSDSDQAFVVPFETLSGKQTAVYEEEKIRFESYFEVQSFRRRSSAVDRFLAGSGRLKKLGEVFSCRLGGAPEYRETAVNESKIDGYGLNKGQREALIKALSMRPLGLVQGPPGTGKTKFIAALTHYVLSEGIVSNVLLTSQSHEAVNTAATSVLKLFVGEEEQPSIIRVANNQSVVAEELRPFSTEIVEDSYRKKFQSQFPEKIRLVSKQVGVQEEVSECLEILESEVAQICQKIDQVSADHVSDVARRNNLVDTLNLFLSRIGVTSIDPNDSSFDASLLFERISEELVKRLVSEEKVSEKQIASVRAVARLGRDFCSSVSSKFRSFESFLCGTRKIVSGTCVGLGRNSLGLTETIFDLVIVDEAARCTSGELLVPLQSAKWTVLVGDQAQLQPTHKPEVIDRVFEETKIGKAELLKSDFERLFRSDYGREAAVSLNTQYRMRPQIGDLVSRVFYPDVGLLHGRSEGVIPEICLPERWSAPLNWIDTSTLGDRAFEHQPVGSSSRINACEADLIIKEIEQLYAFKPFKDWLDKFEASAPPIGVIAMYSAQRDHIRHKLAQSNVSHLLEKQIKVGTVDSYQGKENLIVFLSLVRNNSNGRIEEGRKSIAEGFLANPNRINVALSRAMDSLFVVGSLHNWQSKGTMGQLATAFVDMETEAGVKRLMPE